MNRLRTERQCQVIAALVERYVHKCGGSVRLFNARRCADTPSNPSKAKEEGHNHAQASVKYGLTRCGDSLEMKGLRAKS